MPKYAVTVEFSGTKTYEIIAEDPKNVEDMFEVYSSFDSYDNPIDDRVSETIVRIEEQPEPEPKLEETEFSKNLRLIEQALHVLRFWVEDGSDQTDRDLCTWALEAVEELKKQGA